MTYDLAAMARQAGRRRSVTLRPVNPTQSRADDLAAVISPAWRIWSEGVDRIMSSYNPTPLAIDSPEQTAGVFEQLAAMVSTRLVVDVTPGLRRWAVRLEQWHRGRWVDAVKAGAGVSLDSVLTSQGTTETIEAFIQRNVALVRDVSEQARGRMEDAVYRGYQSRTPAARVAKELREAAGLARARSIRIAGDQNAKLAAALDLQRQTEAGLTQYRWRHSGKAHPRLDHVARDGKLFDIGKPLGDTPGYAPFCGCRAQAYIPLDDEI